MERLEHTSTLREDLYRRRPTEVKAIPILVQPVDIPLATPSDDLTSPPIGLSTAPGVVPSLTMISPPLLGVYLGYPLVALVLGLTFPPLGAACIGLLSVLRCAPAPPWWGVNFGTWPIRTTDVLCSTLK